jgi:hypothetical protein
MVGLGGSARVDAAESNEFTRGGSIRNQMRGPGPPVSTAPHRSDTTLFRPADREKGVTAELPLPSKSDVHSLSEGNVHLFGRISSHRAD